MYQVILYYNFTHIKNVDLFIAHHKMICGILNLKGRIYVAEEGINGTLGGEKCDIEDYMNYLTSLNEFEGTQFKIDDSDDIPFRKLIIKAREEIVSLKTKEDVDPSKKQGKHVSPEEWLKILDSKDDYTLIDVRNNYESAVGHFEGSICPDVENFYDFPDWLDEAKLEKDKKVLMYCTGGIRCEKFSLLMENQGFKDVVQLHGGIINYAKKIGDAHYKGKCFVFDDRLTVPVEKNQKAPLTKCAITNEPCDAYINCANPDCNKLFICSEDGAQKYEGCCSEQCMTSPKKRPFNSGDIYAPSLKWYQYNQGNVEKDQDEPLTEAGTQ